MQRTRWGSSICGAAGLRWLSSKGSPTSPGAMRSAFAMNRRAVGLAKLVLRALPIRSSHRGRHAYDGGPRHRSRTIHVSWFGAARRGDDASSMRWSSGRREGRSSRRPKLISKSCSWARRCHLRQRRVQNEVHRAGPQGRRVISTRLKNGRTTEAGRPVLMLPRVFHRQRLRYPARQEQVRRSRRVRTRRAPLPSRCQLRRAFSAASSSDNKRALVAAAGAAACADR